jgi:hypothetical protein
MPIAPSTYRLKRFVSSRDPGFAEALLLYVRNTPAAERTESNEIAFWLEEFGRGHDCVFYVFGFYRDEQLVGFAEVSYFFAEHLLIFDYLVIDAEHRRNNVFYEFVDHLKRYLEGAHPEYRYGVAEVCYGPNEQNPWPQAHLIVRLLKLQGFHVVRAPYFQPRLLLDDPESEMRADLLIYSSGGIEKLRVETFLAIVRAIYFKYYLPWNSGILEDAEAYERHLKDVYEKIAMSLKGKETVVVNGHKLLLDAPERKPQPRVHRIVAFTVQSLTVIVLLTFVMLELRKAFGLSDSSFASIYVLAVCSFIAMAGIVSKQARAIFSEVLAFAKHIWPKRATPADDKRPKLGAVGRKRLPKTEKLTSKGEN